MGEGFTEAQRAKLRIMMIELRSIPKSLESPEPPRQPKVNKVSTANISDGNSIR